MECLRPFRWCYYDCMGDRCGGPWRCETIYGPWWRCQQSNCEWLPPTACGGKGKGRETMFWLCAATIGGQSVEGDKNGSHGDNTMANPRKGILWLSDLSRSAQHCSHVDFCDNVCHYKLRINCIVRWLQHSILQREAIVMHQNILIIKQTKIGGAAT